MADLETRYQDTVDEITRLRALVLDGGRDDLRGDLSRAKDRCIEAHTEVSRAIESMLSGAPVEYRTRPMAQGPGVVISVTQSVAGVGSRGKYLYPGDPGHAEALEEIERRRMVDALVAEHAYRVWDWRGAVRIDYYGTGAETIARVTDGSRRIAVKLADLLGPG